MQPTTAAQRSDDQDYYGVGALSARELRRRRRELVIGLGLTLPHTPAHRSVELHLAAVETELGTRPIFERAYPAREDQVRVARHAIERYLAGFSHVGEAIMITSELATNAVLHSASRHSGTFTMRADLHRGFLWIETEDVGGPWRGRNARENHEHPHGLDIVGMLCGGNLGVEDVPGGRIVWARLAS
jgi:serine/threonine-protein kinase RsbW